MFTGIIQAVGTVAELQRRGSDGRLRIAPGKLNLHDAELGESIAVGGVCLTVVDLTAAGFAADISGETLSCTTLGALRVGDRVNLERALTPTSRLGGHLVTGHVDGVGRVLERVPAGGSVRFRLEAPAELARYIAVKGSICVDGVSLTVNAVEGACFDLNIIPHTLAETTFDTYRPGRYVNLEVDIVARYLERLLQGGSVPASGGITRDFLTRHGFLGE